MNEPAKMLRPLGVAAAIAAAVFAAPGCKRVPPAPRDIPVLMYHNVLPDDPSLTVWQVSDAEFAWQMDQLAAAGFVPVLPGDVARAAEGRGDLPAKPVVITFDDGYEGVMRNAEPILARRKFRGVCYVVAGLLAGEGDARASFDSGPLLSTNEAAAMAARGVVAVASHSLTHPRGNVPRLTREIGTSLEVVRRLGGDVRSYCYPFGLHGYDAMYAALRENGYLTAMACGDGMFRFGADTNLFAIPRVSVFGGHHDLALLAADPASGVVFSNDGAPLPLRAVVRDPSTGREWRGDLATVGPRPVAFAFPPEAFDGPREFEAWDKFGIFRYWPRPDPARDE